MYIDKETVILLDGDQLAYRAAFACEQEIKWDDDIWSLISSESDVCSSIEAQIAQAQRDTGASLFMLAVSGADNFRKKIYDQYKANRTARKPLGLKAGLDYLRNTYDARYVSTLEADDLLGIEAVENPNSVIWATDKDYLTVPCQLYRNNEMHVITEEEADYNLRLQTMVGDTVDNFKGVKGFGEKTATKWLQKHGDTWESVFKAFEKAGQTKEDFITNAKLARICRHADDVNWKPEL